MNMTYPEYYEAESREVATRYSRTIADIERVYPNRYPEYWALVCEMARAGEVIPARMLDSVANHPEFGHDHIRNLRHDHEKSLPTGYLTPAERKWHKEHPWG